MILVTGHKGFIGKHLTDRLLYAGTGYVGVDLKQGFDVTKDEDLDRINWNDIDTIFHLAAMSDVTECEENPSRALEVNSSSLRKILDRSQVGRFVFPSSAAIYGNVEIPTDEESEKNPKTVYGLSKLQAEQIIRESGVPYSIFRLFNVYGKESKGFISIVEDKIIKREPIRLDGNGEPSRDFVHVDDVVDALIMGMDIPGTYNVGTGKRTRLKDVVGMYGEYTTLPEIQERPEFIGIRDSQADITRISKMGWKPKTGLENYVHNIYK